MPLIPTLSITFILQLASGHLGVGLLMLAAMPPYIILSNNCLVLKLLTRSCYSSSSWFLMKQYSIGEAEREE